jgi:predicted PurR-regulated permease PerM
MPPRPRSSPAQLFLALGGAGVILYFAHAVFVPVALAVLFSLLLSAPVEALNRLAVPRALSAGVILVILLGCVASGIYSLWTPVQSWVAMTPHTVNVIQRKIAPAAKFVQRIEAASDRAGKLTQLPAAPTTAPAAPETKVQAESPGLLMETQSVLVKALTVLILTLFLLSAGPPVIAQMLTFAANAHAAQVLSVYEAIRTELGQYYATIALINVGLGIATFAAMWAIDMPNPLLWGVMAGVFNFIPYVGSTVTFLIIAIVAFTSFDDIGRILAAPGSYLLLATVEGQLIQPLLVGRRLELSPIVVFLAIWLGGWFWSIPGIILAIPALVALKVAAEHHKNGEALVKFLSPSRVKPVSLRKRTA